MTNYLRLCGKHLHMHACLHVYSCLGAGRAVRTAMVMDCRFFYVFLVRSLEAQRRILGQLQYFRFNFFPPIDPRLHRIDMQHTRLQYWPTSRRGHVCDRKQNANLKPQAHHAPCISQNLPSRFITLPPERRLFTTAHKPWGSRWQERRPESWKRFRDKTWQSKRSGIEQTRSRGVAPAM